MSKKPELSDPSGAGRVRIVVYVDGGVVQDVLTDTPGIEAMIVDYDNEKAGDDPACRSFEQIEVNPEYIKKTIECVED